MPNVFAFLSIDWVKVKITQPRPCLQVVDMLFMGTMDCVQKGLGLKLITTLSQKISLVSSDLT